jgi:cardiolipin synthase A/B
VLGNKLTLLQDGPATYQAMFAAMRAAKDHIHLETYIFEDDDIGRQFADLLLERQAAGVQVNLIYDSVGCLNTPREFFERLSAAASRCSSSIRSTLWPEKEGMAAEQPRPPQVAGGRRPHRLHRRHQYQRSLFKRFSMRLTRKREAKAPGLAGHPPADRRAGGGGVPEAVHRHLGQAKGPAAGREKLLSQTRQTGRRDRARHRQRLRRSPQPDLSHAAVGDRHAEQQVHITNAYFVPDPQLLKALTDAARRGVEVKLVLPSHTDSWAVFHAGRSHYSKLLRAGVKIYERRGAVMHSKTASIDGVWSTIGSTNLDWRSFLHNDEINAAILGRDFARQMDAMFARIWRSPMPSISSTGSAVADIAIEGKGGAARRILASLAHGDVRDDSG